jgi:hypothetical protein
MNQLEAFNYLSVMVSIVVGVGLTQLFAGIGNVVQIRRRVDRYWLHTFWVLLLIGFHVQTWWSFWALRAVTDWTFGAFAYVLIGPSTLVIASHIILPELVDTRIDVETHYFDTSPLFFGLLALLAAWVMLLEPVMGLRSFWVPGRLVQGAAACLFVVCAISRDKRLHAAAMLGIATLIGGVIVLTRFHLSEVVAG